MVTSASTTQKVNTADELGWMLWFSEQSQADRDLIRLIAAKGKDFAEMALGLTGRHVQLINTLTGQRTTATPTTTTKTTVTPTAQPQRARTVATTKKRRRAKAHAWTMDQRVALYIALLQLPKEDRRTIASNSSRFGKIAGGVPAKKVYIEYYHNFQYAAGWKKGPKKGSAVPQMCHEAFVKASEVVYGPNAAQQSANMLLAG